MLAHFPSTFPDVDVGDSLNEEYRVRHAGVDEVSRLEVRGQTGQRALFDRRRRREFDFHALARDPGLDRPGRRGETHLAVNGAERVGERGDAPRPVAAHRGFGAVGVEVAHAEVQIRLTGGARER